VKTSMDRDINTYGCSAIIRVVQVELKDINVNRNSRVLQYRVVLEKYVAREVQLSESESHSTRIGMMTTARYPCKERKVIERMSSRHPEYATNINSVVGCDEEVVGRGVG